MPKKARRKKGGGDTGEGGVVDVGDVDVLSESYTVADSVTTARDLDEDFAEFDEQQEPLNSVEEEADEYVSRAALSATARCTKLADVLSLASTIPTEKRSARRESALRQLFKAVSQYATGVEGREAVLSRLDDVIIPACVAGLRSGVASPAEQYASCRVLEATAVVLGGDMDEYVEAITDLLTRAVKATGRAVQVRVAAIRALSMALFICGTDMALTNTCLDLCEAVCAPQFRGEEVDPHLRSAALDCWALLSTTVADAYIAGDDIEGIDGGNGRGVTILPMLQQCLDHGSVELRSAAGECVALIHEARINMGIDADEGENATERRYRSGSWDGSEWEILMDEVKQRVAELSVESGYRLSKKAKKQQRAEFREYMATIVDDESPHHVVTFRGGTLVLNSWREIIQLSYMRHALQAGFQIQLLTNATLQAIFGADGSVLNANSGMSQLEKRLVMSKTSEASKNADKHMTRQRRTRQNVKNHFLTCDGEDI